MFDVDDLLAAGARRVCGPLFVGHFTTSSPPGRPTWVEVDLEAIAYNVRRLKAMAGQAELLITVKANAYGHGAVHVARTALRNGATWFGVACLGEALELREAGIHAPILIFGYTPAWQARDVVQHDISVALFDLDTARALSQAARDLGREAKVHVKVDTGMGRLGVFPHQALDFMHAVRELPGVVIEGVFTHFSVADGASEWERSYTRSQLATFRQVVDQLTQAGFNIPWVHTANSAALLQGLGTGEEGFTLVRPGIAVYGLDPSPEVRCPPDFRPALTWKAEIAQVRTMPDGSYIGYGAAYQTHGEQRIAVIPVGYADGFRRNPKNWGEVLVQGRRVPIVGRVCMDQTMIDVTALPDVRQGDEVVLIGAQGDDRITAEEVAERLGTINYEVVAGIRARVPRKVVGG